jgi:putative Mg2+ transporter-C (MgtC) family protein
VNLPFLANLLLASGLGCLIGLERQWHQRFAGLRTNALVATGSAAFAGLALSPILSSNASPYLGQIITGVGFLGAGVIFKEGFNVRGLNTAATLWCAAAVGTLAGIGETSEACMVALLVLTLNTTLRMISTSISRRAPDPATEMESHYHLELSCSAKSLQILRELLWEQAIESQILLRAVKVEGQGKGRSRLQADLVTQGRNDRAMESLSHRLGLEAQVRSVHWQLVSSATHFE